VQRVQTLRVDCLAQLGLSHLSGFMPTPPLSDSLGLGCQVFRPVRMLARHGLHFGFDVRIALMNCLSIRLICHKFVSPVDLFCFPFGQFLKIPSKMRGFIRMIKQHLYSICLLDL
jgi:hypothetical protein